ncbi:MAG TPA: alpha/beta hydrolase [Candidatus Dormibacteraeota bacterium]
MSPTAPKSRKVQSVLVEGRRIAYERAGEGPPVVLLHGGFGLDRRSWRWQLEGLSDEFMVVAWDAPGCGHSSDPPDTFRSHDYADCLAAFIDALDLGHPHVCGLSFGGVLALELYHQHPTVPRSLVLAGAYAGWAGSLPADVVQQRLTRIRREVELPPEQWVRGYVPGFFTKGAPPELIEEIVAMMCELHPAGLRTFMNALGEADLRDVLPLIDVLTLLLYGDADERAPLTIAEDFHNQISGSNLVVMPGVAHVSSAEFPEQFNAEVRSFLRSL